MSILLAFLEVNFIQPYIIKESLHTFGKTFLIEKLSFKYEIIILLFFLFWIVCHCVTHCGQIHQKVDDRHSPID